MKINKIQNNNPTFGTQIGKNLQEKSGELYAAYRAFCARTNDFCRSTSEFYTALEQRGFTRKKFRNGMMVFGLKLSEPESEF